MARATNTQSKLPALTGISLRWWTLVACCMASCAKNIEPPLWIFRPPVIEAFNTGWARYSLLMSVVSLGALAFLLMGGVLGDIFGRQRLLIGGLAGLIIANGLVALSPDPLWFVITRFIAGAAGTLILPLSLTMLYLAFEDDVKARTTAISIYVIITSTAFLISGLLGQLMKQLFDWRATFVLPTILAVGGLALIRLTTAESQVEQTRRFDVIGHAAWALTALGLLFGMVVSFTAGPYTTIILSAAVAAVVLGIGVLIWWDTKTPDSIFGQSKILRRALFVLIIYGVAMQIGFVGFVNLVRNTLITVYDYGAVLAAVGLAPLLLGMVVMTIYGMPQLIGQQPRTVMCASLVAAACIIIVAVLTRAASFYPWLGLLLACFGAAIVAANTAWTSVFFASIPGDAIGIRTGINSSIFQCGGAIGGTLTSSLLAGFGLANYQRLLLVEGVESRRIDDALGALASILDPATPDAALDPNVSSRLVAGYQFTYLAAYNQVLLIIAGLCVLAALLVWVALRRNRPKPNQAGSRM